MRRGLLLIVVGLELVGVGRTAWAFQSDVTYWQQAVWDAPEALAPRVNLAVAVGLTGDGDRAQRLSTEALALAPTAPGASFQKASAGFALLTLDRALAAGPLPHVVPDGFVGEDRSWLRAARQPIALTRRPVTLMTLHLQQGAGIGAYRLVNLALHLMTVGLVIWLGSHLGAARSVAWSAGVVWGLLPWHVETVLALSGRGELLATLWILIACLCLEVGEWRLALVTWGLAILSKETAIVGLALLPWWGARRWHRGVTFGLSALVALSLAYRHVATWPYVRPGVWAWAREQAAALLQQIAGWSHPPVWIEGGTIAAAWTWLALVGVAGVGLIVWAWPARWPHRIAFGLGWAFFALLPRFIVSTPGSFLHAHQLYLPSIGIAWACLTPREAV